MAKEIKYDMDARDLLKKGVQVQEDIDKITSDNLVIIRAHGVGENVYKKFLEKNIEFLWVTSLFQLFISCHKLLVCIFSEPRPEHYYTHLTCLQFFVVLILLTFYSH